MTEATDRPQGTEQRVSSPPMPAAPEERLGTRTPESAEPYRPLSLLAMAGLGVAVLYAAVVVLGGAIALFNRSPWLLSSWTFLIPFAALILCWLARARIRDSERTLSGLAFTTWGVRLAVLVGLLYTAYYAFSFFAVRLQAIDCADQFFAQMKQSHPDRAFLLAMGESVRDMEDREVRDMVEGRFNSSRSQAGGVYDQFRRSPFVRAIKMTGSEARIAPTGVNDWGYKQGGYRVALKYHVSTPLVEFDMNVETFGPDSQPGETRGRQWHVVLPGGETHIIPSTMKLTSHGKDIMNDTRMAWDFASRWQEKINQLAWEDAYLDTLDPAQREHLLKGHGAVRMRATAPLAGPGALGLYDETARDFLASRHKLAESKLIRIDDQRFWTNKAQRDAIVDRIQKTFRLDSGGVRTFSLNLQQAEMPELREADGRVVVLFDAHLTYLDGNTTRPKYLVGGQLVVSAPAAEAGRSPAVWRVESIELESGRVPPMMERPSGGGAPPPEGAIGP